MSRIASTFRRLKKTGQRAFIPFVTCGDPDAETTLAILHALEEAGADMIELGIPFSDPMADGPVIQRASERALASGMTLRGVLEIARRFREKSKLPIILFGYYNPIFRYGIEAIARDAAEAGVDAFLCVDLPPEESSELETAARTHGLDLIYLLAPTSTLARLRKVLKRARGFVYFVAVTGVTGTRTSLPENLESLVGSIRRVTRLPVGVGFGISTAEQAATVARFADSVIVGSAIARVIEDEGRNAPEAVRVFAADLVAGIRSV